KAARLYAHSPYDPLASWQEDDMVNVVPMLLILVVLAAVSVSPLEGGAAQQSGQSHIVPLKEFASGQTFETVSCEPTKPGELFVIRTRREAGYIIMPHTHPID